VVDVPGALGVHGGLPVGNLKEFIAYAKAQGGKLSYGSAGYGSAQRMALEFFMKKAGIKMRTKAAPARRPWLRSRAKSRPRW
jgi:tripartite-type tricarboxylate transporter receptor subunit TctC